MEVGDEEDMSGCEADPALFRKGGGWISVLGNVQERAGGARGRGGLARADTASRQEVTLRGPVKDAKPALPLMPALLFLYVQKGSFRGHVPVEPPHAHDFPCHVSSPIGRSVPQKLYYSRLLSIWDEDWLIKAKLLHSVLGSICETYNISQCL